MRATRLQSVQKGYSTAYSLPLFFPAQYTRLVGPKAPGDSVPASHLALRL